jgi:hypothetical protein
MAYSPEKGSKRASKRWKSADNGNYRPGAVDETGAHRLRFSVLRCAVGGVFVVFSFHFSLQSGF